MASIRVAGGVLAIFLIQKCPRVKLNMVMMTTMSLSMLALGSVEFVKETFPGISSTAIDIIPVLSATLCMFCFGAGAGEEKRWNND